MEACQSAAYRPSFDGPLAELAREMCEGSMMADGEALLPRCVVEVGRRDAFDWSASLRSNYMRGGD